MISVEQVIAVQIKDDYAAVSDLLKWLAYDKSAPLGLRLGGYSGRGGYLGFFTVEEKDQIDAFFKSREERKTKAETSGPHDRITKEGPRGVQETH